MELKAKIRELKGLATLDPNAPLGKAPEKNNDTADPADYSIQNEIVDEITFSIGNGESMSLLYDLGEVNPAKPTYLTPSERKTLVDKLHSLMPWNVDIVYVENWDSEKFPHEKKPSDKVRGVHMQRITGTEIYLNGSLLTTKEAIIGTFAHETLGHAGLRSLFHAGIKTDAKPNARSKFDNFLLNLFSNNKDMRQAILNRRFRWSGYLDAWKVNNVPNWNKIPHTPGTESNEQTKAYLAHLALLEKTNEGQRAIVNHRVNGVMVEIQLPQEIVINLVDEHLAEMAKDLFFTEGFLNKAVGAGLSSTKRDALMESRYKWFNNFLAKVRHLLQSVFGDYFNSISNKELTRIMAMSAERMFTNANPDAKETSSHYLDHNEGSSIGHNMDWNVSSFEDESITSLMDRSKGTLKVLNSIPKDIGSKKFVNKYSYTKMKIIEVSKKAGVSNEEKKLLDEALEELGTDGKWSWQDLVNTVQLKLSDVTLNVSKNQEWSTYGLNRIIPKDLVENPDFVASKLELSIKSLDGTTLTFPGFTSLKTHGLGKDAASHIRFFSLNGIVHIAEVQSDLSQQFKKLTGDIDTHRSDMVDEFLENKNVERAFKQLKELYESSQNMESMDRSDLKFLLFEAIDNFSDITKKDYLNLNQNLADIFSTSPAGIVRGLNELVEDGSKMQIRDAISDSYNYIFKLKGEYLLAQLDPMALTTNLQDEELTRFLPYVEKRTIREMVRNISMYSGTDLTTFRLATSDTVAKIEQWDLTQEKPANQARNYAKLAKSMASELSMKIVTDEFGNTWYEGVIGEEYTPISYDVAENKAAAILRRKVGRETSKKLNAMAEAKLTARQRAEKTARIAEVDARALEDQAKRVEEAQRMTKFNELDSVGVFAIHESIGQKTWNKFNNYVEASPLFKGLKVLGNLPQQEALQKIIRKATGFVNIAENKAVRIGKILKGVNSIQNYAINKYMTTADADINELSSLLSPLQMETIKDAKDTIIKYGDYLVSIGALDYDSYKENKGKYLHITYLEYINKNMGSGYKVSYQSYLKARKDKTEAERMLMGEIKDVEYTIPQTLGVMTRDFHLLNMFREINMFSHDQKVYWALTPQKNIRDPENRKRTLSLVDAVDKLNQLETMNVSYSRQMEGIFDVEREKGLQTSLAAEARLRTDIEEAQDQILTEAFNHAVAIKATTATDKATFLTQHYKQMPNTPQFGELRKMWVRKEIASDLHDLTNPYDLSGKTGIDRWMARGGGLERMNTYWKQSMTTLNPGFWPRAFLGNFYLLDTSRSTFKGTLIGDLHSELSTHLKGEESYWWKHATQYGQFGSTMGAIELNNLQRDFGSKLIEAKRANELRGEGSTWDKALHFLDERMIVMGGMLNNATQNTFNLMEGMFKVVAFKDYVRTWEKQTGRDHKALSEVEMDVLFSNAAKDASDAIFDYSQVHHAIKFLRRVPLGDPFITFTYKVIPATLKSAVTHPIKLAQYAALPSLLTMIAMATNDWDDDDLHQFKKSMSEAQRTNVGTFLMPFKDEKGRVQTMSLDPVLGYSVITNTSRHIYDQFRNNQGENPAALTALSLHTLSKDLGILGAPVPKIIGAFITGKDGFTGKDIMNPGESASNQIFDMMKYMGNMVAPNFLSGHGFAGKMMESLSITLDSSGFHQGNGPEMSRQGEVKTTNSEALSSITGFGTTPIMEKTGISNVKTKFDVELKDIGSLRNKIASDRNIPSESRAIKLKEVTQRLKSTRERMMKAMK
jgi:hypothetical protein